MIKISSANQVLFFKANQIVCFEAKTKTTLVHFLDGEIAEIAEPIESIKKQIGPIDFIQIQNNHLINVNHITGIPGKNTGFIELNKTLLLPISREQREIITQLISAHLKTKKIATMKKLFTSFCFLALSVICLGQYKFNPEILNGQKQDHVTKFINSKNIQAHVLNNQHLWKLKSSQMLKQRLDSTISETKEDLEEFTLVGKETMMYNENDFCTNQIETGTNEWDHRWSGNNDFVIYSDDPNFDPNKVNELNHFEYKRSPVKKSK